VHNGANNLTKDALKKSVLYGAEKFGKLLYTVNITDVSNLVEIGMKGDEKSTQVNTVSIDIWPTLTF
jgi:hypothetical protein